MSKLHPSQIEARIQKLFENITALTTELLTIKALVVEGNAKVGSLTIGSTAVTSTAAELNYVDVTAIGTAQASKAVVLDASKDIAGLNAVSAATVTTSGKTTVGSLKIGLTDVTSTGAELNLLDGADYGANDSAGTGYRFVRVANA